MGLYIQFQRAAIETFVEEPEAVAPPSIRDLSSIFDSNGNQLYYGGISDGVGTCADIKGMDVLGLTDSPTTDRRYDKAAKFACSYTILVRSLTLEERAEDSLAQEGVARSCVELLNPLPIQDESRIIFERTGKVAIYTCVI